MLTVFSIKPESKQDVMSRGLDYSKAASISNNIKSLSNENKKLKSGESDFVRGSLIEVYNPLYKSCKVESQCSLYESSPVEKLIKDKIDFDKVSKAEEIYRMNVIKEIKSTIETINLHFDSYPDIRVYAKELLEAKCKAEKITGTPLLVNQPPEFLIDPDKITPRKSIDINQEYLYVLLDLLEEFCNK